jgi:hypothetical protein
MKSPSWQSQSKKEVFDNYGVPGFLSKDTFSQTYQKYIEHLATRLNEFVAGAIKAASHIQEFFSLTSFLRYCR